MSIELQFSVDTAKNGFYNTNMDYFGKPIFTDVKTPKSKGIFTADFIVSSPWGDCDITFNWTNTDFAALHNHNHWEMFVVVSGRIDHFLNGESRMLSRGDSYLISPTDIHCFKYLEADYQQVNILIKSKFLEEYLSVYKKELYADLLNSSDPLAFKIPENVLQNGLLKLLTLQNINGSLEENVFQTKLVFNSFIQSFFEQNFSCDNVMPQWLIKLLNELNKPTAYRLSTEDIMELTPYSYSRFCTLFKKYTGKTIHEYMTDIKLVYSQKQLRFTDKTTLEISNDIGFSSLSHFNHIFKKTFGMTPTEYRSKFK